MDTLEQLCRRDKKVALLVCGRKYEFQLILKENKNDLGAKQLEATLSRQSCSGCHKTRATFFYI